jgi:hypothetical protein
MDTSFERKNLVRRRNWQIRRAHQALANQPSFRKATSVKILSTPQPVENSAHPKKGNAVIHPSQFQPNVAWLAFKLNDTPIRTELDGELNFIALMDAASCYILGSEVIAANAVELPKIAAKRLMKKGQTQAQRLPNTRYIPHELPATSLAQDADRLGITVVSIAEEKLMILIGDA